MSSKVSAVLSLLCVLSLTACSSSSAASAGSSASTDASSVQESTSAADSTDEKETASSADDKITAEDGTEYHDVTDYEVYTKTDYVHCVEDAILLGYGETLTITVKAEPNTVDANDFWIQYDDPDSITTSFDVQKEDTYALLTITVTADQETGGTFSIGSYTDYYEDTSSDQIKCVSFSFYALNEEQGRIVYADGENSIYHYDENCAGGTATTLTDVQLCEFTPCEKCVGE